MASMPIDSEAILHAARQFQEQRVPFSMTRDQWSDMGRICNEIGKQSTRALEGRRRARFIEMCDHAPLELPWDQRLGPVKHVLMLVLLGTCSCGLAYYIGQKGPNIGQFLKVIGRRFTLGPPRNITTGLSSPLLPPQEYPFGKTDELCGRKRKRASSIGIVGNIPKKAKIEREVKRSIKGLSLFDSLDLAREHAGLRVKRPIKSFSFLESLDLARDHSQLHLESRSFLAASSPLVIPSLKH